MILNDITTKPWILAMFVREDGERFLLGDGGYEFTNKQNHFAGNNIKNDIVEMQGSDGVLLAGQVRRASNQSFVGYIGDGSTSAANVEKLRQAFFGFFQTGFFYKVVYIFCDGSAVKRQRGFLVEAPEVKELFSVAPEYKVALNFEDVNYYSYSEDDEGNEISPVVVQFELMPAQASEEVAVLNRNTSPTVFEITVKTLTVSDGLNIYLGDMETPILSYAETIPQGSTVVIKSDKSIATIGETDITADLTGTGGSLAVGENTIKVETGSYGGGSVEIAFNEVIG